MNIRHPRWPWTFEQHDGPIRTSSQRGGLWKQTSIGQRRREICVRFPLDDNPAAKVNRRLDVNCLSIFEDSLQRRDARLPLGKRLGER